MKISIFNTMNLFLLICFLNSVANVKSGNPTEDNHDGTQLSKNSQKFSQKIQYVINAAKVLSQLRTKERRNLAVKKVKEEEEVSNTKMSPHYEIDTAKIELPIEERRNLPVKEVQEEEQVSNANISSVETQERQNLAVKKVQEEEQVSNANNSSVEATNEMEIHPPNPSTDEIKQTSNAASNIANYIAMDDVDIKQVLNPPTKDLIHTAATNNEEVVNTGTIEVANIPTTKGALITVGGIRRGRMSRASIIGTSEPFEGKKKTGKKLAKKLAKKHSSKGKAKNTPQFKRKAKNTSFKGKAKNTSFKGKAKNTSFKAKPKKYVIQR